MPWQNWPRTEPSDLAAQFDSGAVQWGSSSVVRGLTTAVLGVDWWVCVDTSMVSGRYFPQQGAVRGA